MKPMWFIHRDGVVLGPFAADEVQRRIDDGSLGADCLIWARGTSEWTPVSQWSDLSNQVAETQKTPSGRVWYCDSGGGQPAGPLTQDELIHHLKGLNRWDVVQLWGTGLPKWIPLFEVPEVMDLVGISRREHPRAPLLGQIALTPVGSSIPAQVLSALTISVGGFGVKGGGFLSRGDRVQLAIKSRDLPTVIHATGEVLYVARNGEAGVKFTDLSAEARSIVFDHVRRFHDSASRAA